MPTKCLLADIVDIAKQAGSQILSLYQGDLGFTKKLDGSPVTLADMAAQSLILQRLSELTPEIPIISEESLGHSTRPSWLRYWLVDPLDGSKEFLEKNGEFTVNIALIEEHKPILGVVYAPALDFCYFAKNRGGAFKQWAGQPTQALHTHSWRSHAPVSITMSRHHSGCELAGFFEKFPAFNLIRSGSALKFCYVAEGFADLYPRLGATQEWDTAAGQCILQEAGGALVDLKGQALRYDSSTALLHAAFLAVGDVTHDWSQYFT